MINKLRIGGPLLSPWICDAQTNEPITCVTGIEFFSYGLENGQTGVRLTIPYEFLDLEHVGNSFLFEEWLEFIHADATRLAEWKAFKATRTEKKIGLVPDLP